MREAFDTKYQCELVQMEPDLTLHLDALRPEFGSLLDLSIIIHYVFTIFKLRYVYLEAKTSHS